MTAADRHPHFARFFRAVEGKLVARYGTARATKGNDIIGGIWIDDPDQSKPDLFANGAPRRKLIQDLDAVTAITHLEARRFRREYDRAVRNGDLEEVTRADYEAFLKADAAKVEAAASLSSKSNPSSSSSSSRKRKTAPQE